MRLRNIALVGALVLAFGNAQATLFDRGGGLIYDDVLNITWLQDANYAATSGYVLSGTMTWAMAINWAAGLSYYDNVRNVTYSDWRLPQTFVNRFGYNNTDVELGHLFYTDLGGVAKTSIFSVHNSNLSLFINLKDDYWFSNDFSAAGMPNEAADFSFAYGYQGAASKSAYLQTWAVRDGDVAAPVPEPETYAMMLAGLGLLGVMARRRKQLRH
jgi:hypothetical protein